MSTDINRPFSYGSGIAFQDSQRDSLYAKGNQLNEQTPQGAQTAILGEPKLGQTALVVAKRGIIGIPNPGPQETNPSGSTTASPDKLRELKPFAKLRPKIEQITKYYENRIDHSDDPQEQHLLRQELRSEIHYLLAIPQSHRIYVPLDYADAKGQPYRYEELNRVIYEALAKILEELENSPGQGVEREAQWCKELLARKDAVRFTESLVDTQELLLGIERLRSKFIAAVEVERSPSGIERHSKKEWENAEIKKCLGNIQSGIATIIEWLTADNEGRNRMLQMPKAHKRGLNFFQSLTSIQSLMSKNGVQQYTGIILVSQLPERIAYTRKRRNGQIDINVSSNHLQSRSVDIGAGSMVHELGHVLDGRNRVILEKCIAFFPQINLLDKDYYLKDLLLYKNSKGEVTGTEILSTGVERIWDDPVKFFKEYPHWFGFVIDTLRGLDISTPDVSQQDHPGLIRCFEVAS